MKIYQCSIALLGAIITVVVTSMDSNEKQTIRARDEFVSFSQGLGVPSSEIETLGNRLASTDTAGGVLNIGCLLAKSKLGGAVDVRPLNQTVVDENWSQTCIFEPFCIIQPKNAEEVSIVLRIINFFRLKFSIRSGGHSPNPGWSSVGEHGILLDLGRLNSVSVSSDAKFASIGPAARWGDVYAALDPHRLVVLGGRVPGVGVGGLLLGGGYFHLPTWGFAADTVKNFEVVTSDGKILNANSEENQDLFWALRWRRQLRCHKVDDLIDAFYNWQQNGASDANSNVALNIGIDTIALMLIYGKPLERPPDVFSHFFDIEPLAAAVPGSNLTFNVINQLVAATISSTPARHDYRGYSSRPDAELFKEVYRFWLAKAIDVRNATGANQTFVVQHVSEHMIQRGIDAGGNSMGIPPGAQQWWTTLVDWEKEADDDLARSVAIDTTKEWESLGQARGLNLSYIYANDAARDQNPLATRDTETLDRLTQVSKKYDPSQMFQKLQNDGFLLSRA
ncbi:FAD-binding domain-containing protein [Thozetella sp. PMI_491]|nr:FAD-binding domain-containing protein [Thozetella sp. PMI_491]